MRKLFTLLFIVAALALSAPAHASYRVFLAWQVGVGDDPTVAYNVYRSIDGGATYQLLAADIAPTTYIDAVVVQGKTYQYYVTALDALNAESTPSNITVVSVPTLQLNPATNPKGTLVAEIPPGFFLYPLVYPSIQGEEIL